MPEHRPGDAQCSDPIEALRCVTLPEIPTVYALDEPDDGVIAWVLAMPGGDAVMVSSTAEDSFMVDTSLDLVVRRWAPLWGADLVLVTT